MTHVDTASGALFEQLLDAAPDAVVGSDTSGTIMFVNALAERRARAYNATSLSTPIGADSATELADTLGAEDHGFELTELRIALGPAIAAPDERERTILTVRFHGNKTQSEIAEQVGISQMHVSRLIIEALLKPRQHLGADSR